MFSTMGSEHKRGLVHSFTVDFLQVFIYENEDQMASAAAKRAADYLRSVLGKQDQARIILASAVSQIRFLGYLTSEPEIDWERVTVFHMDEYLGIKEDHKASFRRFIRQHVQSRIPQAKYEFIQGDAAEPLREVRRYCELLHAAPIDLCCLGIGENGHIAFNDPHVANLYDPLTVKLVQLDERCRQQQVHDGAFASVDEVPAYAYTITIPGLLRAQAIIGVVPGRRKAEAVRRALEGPICSECPASALRQHRNAALFLDLDSASLLSQLQSGC